MISAAVGRGGETMISAQTIEAFWNAVKHVKPISVGLNCSLGPDLMYPFLAELSEKSNAAISCYPNAGLPNPLSATGFDLGPEDMARYLGDFARGGLINIAGGCCGNTPEHIAAIAKALDRKPPRHIWPSSTAEQLPEKRALYQGMTLVEPREGKQGIRPRRSPGRFASPARNHSRSSGGSS